MSRFSRIAIVAFFLCLSLCLATEVHSADYRMRLFTMDDGLSNSNINSIIQDRRGFLWIGTSSGLNRFDGYDFTVHIPGKEIKCLFEDSKGNIWAGLLDGKVCRMDSMTGAIREYVCYFPSESNNGDVSGFLESDKGFMWVSVDRMGLVKLDPETGGHIRYEYDSEDSSSLSNNAVTDMEMASDGSGIWLSTWGGGLNLFNFETGKFSHPLEALKDEDPLLANQSCLYQDGTELWVGTTYSGILRYDTASGELKHYVSPRDGISSNTTFDIAADGDGNVWAATGEGISIWDREKESFSTISIMVDNSPAVIRSSKVIFLDRDKTMWMGTSKGLLQYNREFSKFGICVPARQLAVSGQTSAILKDNSGSVWMVDDRGLHINRFDENGVCCREDKCSGLRYDNIGALYLDSRGDVWIGYDSGVISRYSSERAVFENFDLNKGNPDSDNAFRTIYCFCEDTDGSLWLGGEVGVVNFNPATGKVMDLYRPRGLIFPSFKTMDILLDRRGNLWTATQGGIFRYGKGSSFQKRYTSDPDAGNLESNIVNCLLEDSSGTIWACTTGGLDRYDPNTDRFVKVEMVNGLSLGNVTGAQEDEAGNLWMTTSGGLVCMGTNREFYRIFDEEDGLLGKEFMRGAMTKSTDGEILLGSCNGANRFYPSRLSPASKVPDVHIDGLSIFNKPLIPLSGGLLPGSPDKTDCITLSYDQSMLTFSFVALNFIASRRDKYYYMLEGVDDHWVAAATGVRSATYANLSPGNYVFRVKVTTDDSRYESSPVRMEIVIKPPFWATWWAWLFYVLAALFVIAAFIYFYLRRQRLKNRHEMDEFKLQFFTNVSHEFRTSLTLILGPLDYLLASGTCPEETRPMLSMMKGNASRLLRLVNQLLDFRKVEARKMTVNNSTQDIVHFLKDVYNVFVPYASQQGVEYVFSSGMGSLVMDFDKDKVDKVVYNLLSNAFKYTAVGGRIELSLGTEEKDGRIFVTIRVRDNGIGMSAETVRNLFTMFYQSPDRKSRFSGGSGLGLNMTKELLSIMGGHIEVESKEGEGSVFTAYIPCVCSGEMEEDMSAAEYSGPEDSEEEDDIPERNRPLVLVVDDNPDMQTYIRTALEGRFNVICAGDGEEGLQKTVRQMPDIIVSDVMMPGMDGMTFYSRLKDDERTSHIPVIMLSAISDESKIAESFRMGVDAYMTKPFSPDVLTARIENIFLKRREQRTAAGAADSFAGKLMECVNGNVQDPNYGIERLAKDMNLSAVQLSRKCKESLDMTPYSLIIKARMDTAVRLMKETDLNISEIAFRCGYQELSNFSRAFTRYWNESPKHLMKKVHK